MASIILSANSVLENPTAGTVIGTLSVLGGKNNETFSYTLADSLSDRFEIKLNAITGQYELVVKSADPALFDYDNGQQGFTISVSAASDASGNPTVVDSFTTMINVIDNVAPTDITLSQTSVVEHSGAGTVVADLYAVDANLKDTFTFTLLNDAEGRFEIKNGQLVVKDGSKLDYLTAASHKVQIQVTDADSNTFTEEVTINITDALELRNGTWKNDKIYGTEGGDAINGLSGNDWIFGNGGDDVINGGRGKDFLYGGAGKDTFVFDTSVKRGEFDQVRDFNPADDTIQLNLSSLKTFKVKTSIKDLFWAAIKGGNPHKKQYYSLDKVMKHGKLDSKFFSTSYKAKDSNDFVYYNKKNGFVYFDADGSGREKGIEILKLQKGLILTADDFLMI